MASRAKVRLICPAPPTWAAQDLSLRFPPLLLEVALLKSSVSQNQSPQKFRPAKAIWLMNYWVLSSCALRKINHAKVHQSTYPSARSEAQHLRSPIKGLRDRRVGRQSSLRPNRLREKLWFWAKESHLQARSRQLRKVFSPPKEALQRKTNVAQLEWALKEHPRPRSARETPKVSATQQASSNIMYVCLTTCT